ncbi:MAG: radical SAM protein [Helicobacteraceae bacterium]|jgi:radical SAM protein with 4Fe4S-binding SPASM domain|nr:radical SAM protein [Helicobacteraceae bacterium]
MSAVLRAKTDRLIQTRPLSADQSANTIASQEAMRSALTRLTSKPQRFVFEMTSACNLNCAMCGRNSADFKPTRFNLAWLAKFDDVSRYAEEVTLMGWGEPTAHPSFVEFLKWASKNKLRKYFCTNGMKLSDLTASIFDERVDVIAVSIDAADEKLNNEIRRGSKMDRIFGGIKAIVEQKRRLNTPFPYINFVTTLMHKNLREFPKIVRLASDLGLQEAKAVFLTAFDDALAEESLWERMDEVKEAFDEATEIAQKLGIQIKIPHLRGEDPAKDLSHKPCFTAWRDFFLGSDGFVRPCMSTPIKLFHIDKYADFEAMWNSEETARFRSLVNNEDRMPESCRYCYQSSFANWNKRSSWFQTGLRFSPEWAGKVYE